jgi:hypothetical protein
VGVFGAKRWLSVIADYISYLYSLAETLHTEIVPTIYRYEMRLERMEWGPVLFCGWLVILVSAAMILPPTDSKILSAIALPILVLMLIWLLLSVVALSFYFYRGWRRVAVIPNKTSYIAWMSIETGFALAVLGGIVWFFVTPS